MMNQNFVAAVENGQPMPPRLLSIVAICLGTSVAVIVLLMIMFPCSSLGDRIGLKRMYQIGQMLFIIASVMCFFAYNLPLILIARGVQGLGAAASLSVMIALIRNVYPSHMIGKGIAVNAVVVSISATAAPALGGVIAAYTSWAWLFVVAVPFALVSLALGVKNLPDVPRVTDPFRIRVAFLNVASFGLIFGGTEIFVQGNLKLVAAIVVIAGIICLIGLVKRELPHHEPIFPVDLLRRRTIGLSALAASIGAASSTVVVLWLPFMLAQQYGFSLKEVGVILMSSPFASMLVGPFSGALSDRTDAGVLGVVGMGVVTIAAVLLLNVPANPHILDFIWRMVLYSVGSSLFWIPNARLIVHSTPIHRTAAAGSVIQIMRLTGQTLGASLISLMFSLGITSDLSPFYIVLTFSSVTLALSVYISIISKPSKLAPLTTMHLK